MITENELLDHIYQTAEMGGVGIRAVLRRADEPKLTAALNAQLTEYQKLRRAAGEQLRARGQTPRSVGMAAMLSAEMMSSAKTMLDHSATKIAELMIQGSTMGVTKSLRTIRDCNVQDCRVGDLADRLLKTEEANIVEMKGFL